LVVGLLLLAGTALPQGSKEVFEGDVIVKGLLGVGVEEPQARLEVAGSVTASGIVSAQAFVGSGTELTSLNASNITSGTLASGHLPWDALDRRYTPGRLVIPASAFVPTHDGCDYSHSSIDYLNDNNGCDYVAPVFLPEDAEVTRVEIYWSAPSGSGAELHLERARAGKSHENMAIISVSGPCRSAPCSKSESTIEFNPIDNWSYHYGVKVDASGGNFTLYKVVISYRRPR